MSTPPDERAREQEVLEKLTRLGQAAFGGMGSGNGNGNPFPASGGGAEAVVPDVPPEPDLSSEWLRHVFDLPSSSEKFRLPNGDWVYVHAPNHEETVFATYQVSREMAALRLNDPAAQQTQLMIRLALWYSVLVCRTGDRYWSPRYWPDVLEAAMLLRQHPAYADSLHKIYLVSVAQGEAGKTGSEQALEELMQAFFALQTRLSTLSSGLSRATLSQTRKELAACAEYVSHTTQHVRSALNWSGVLKASSAEEE